jgi:hypothetical protein
MRRRHAPCTVPPLPSALCWLVCAARALGLTRVVLVLDVGRCELTQQCLDSQCSTRILGLHANTSYTTASYGAITASLRGGTSPYIYVAMYVRFLRCLSCVTPIMWSCHQATRPRARGSLQCGVPLHTRVQTRNTFVSGSVLTSLAFASAGGATASRSPIKGAQSPPRARCPIRTRMFYTRCIHVHLLPPSLPLPASTDPEPPSHNQSPIL